jgi:hypothetical protein
MAVITYKDKRMPPFYYVRRFPRLTSYRLHGRIQERCHRGNRDEVHD